MQEQVRTEGIANHLSLRVPEVVLQVVHDGLGLLIKRQRPKVTPSLAACDIKAPIHQTLTQTRRELTPVAGEVIDGAVFGEGHVLIVNEAGRG